MINLEVKEISEITNKKALSNFLVFLIPFFAWLPEFIVQWMWYETINGTSINMGSYGNILNYISTLYIHTWSVTTLTYLQTIGYFRPIYFLWWIVGYSWITTGYLAHGYVITYIALQSVPITGQLTLFSFLFWSYGISYEFLFGVSFTFMAILLLLVFLIRGSYFAAIVSFTIGVVLGILMFLNYGTFEIKIATFVLLGFFSIIKGLNKKTWLLFGISMLTSTGIVYLVLFYLSQTVLSFVTYF